MGKHLIRRTGCITEQGRKDGRTFLRTDGLAYGHTLLKSRLGHSKRLKLLKNEGGVRFCAIDRIEFISDSLGVQYAVNLEKRIVWFEIREKEKFFLSAMR